MAAFRVQPHIERAFVLHGESARRIIDLHGGNAEVGEDEIGAREIVPGKNLRQTREIAPMRLERFRRTDLPK